MPKSILLGAGRRMMIRESIIGLRLWMTEKQLLKAELPNGMVGTRVGMGDGFSSLHTRHSSYRHGATHT